MSINWNEIVEVYRSQSWWVWLVGVALVWIAFMAPSEGFFVKPR